MLSIGNRGVGCMRRNIIVALGIAGLAIGYYALPPHVEAGNMKTAVAMSADAARYNADDMAALATKLDAAGIPMAETVIKRFVTDGVPAQDVALFTVAAYSFAEATDRSILTTADQVSRAFTSGPDAVRKLDRDYNFLSSGDYEKMLDLEKTGQFGAAMNVAKTTLRTRIMAAAN